MFPAGSQSDGVSSPLAIQQYFEVVLYLLVITGFATLAATGQLDLVTVAFVGLALLLRGYLLANHRTLLVPERWTTALTLVYVAFYLTDYFLISRSFLSATVHLVLFVMVLRLFSAQRDRDYYFLVVISFLMVLAAAVLTVNSAFLLAFASFMLMAVVTFILMEMRRASRQATVRAKELSDTRASRKMAVSLAVASPALVFFILLGAAAIFFVLPRISNGYLSANAPGGTVATGFSDRVQLGRIGQIQQSNTLVMHIQIDNDARGAFDLKWRGVTLNIFNGREWSNPHENRVVTGQGGGRFNLREPNVSPESPRLASRSRPIHYRVLMEPVIGSVFFLAPVPRTLDGSYSLISTDNAGGFFDLDSDHPISAYEATSDIAQPGPAELRSASNDYPAEVQLKYLQLQGLDPRIPKLAEKIAAAAGNNYDKAVAIETYLRTNFAYTLQLSRTLPRDPVANFLFDRKQGHCEYFASAMALMLRTLAIPSRVVNGFRTGEFNDLTSQYLVRESNAHSWVEAFFPGYGWISFDPTPAAPTVLRTGWSRVALYADALSSFWREWVINYDLSHQYTLGKEATRSGVTWFHRLRGWGRRRYEALLKSARTTQEKLSSSPLGWGMAATVSTILLTLAANARRLWQLLRIRRIAARPEQSPGLAASIWYQRMARLLARLGWHRSPAQTPQEFLLCISDETIRASVARFTQQYESARFGESVDAARRLPELYDEISSVARR